MGWWTYGINGSKSYASSGSATLKYGTLYDISGYRQIGSISMDANKPLDQPYRVLLNTFSLGTQIYAELTPSKHTEYVKWGDNWEPTPVIRHGVSLLIKQGDYEIYFARDFGRDVFEYFIEFHPAVIGQFSIYYRLYAEATVVPLIPVLAFPRDGRGGGLTNQIAIISHNNGIDFYVVGYTSSGEMGGTNYFYQCPAYKLGTLSSEYLNDPTLFDGNVDAYQPDEGSDDGPGYGIPGLPTSPSYPGTDVDFPDLPTGANAFDFSRLTLFKPTAANLASALDILYSDETETTLETIIESCKKWWYKPDQYCISLMLSPVDATAGTSKNIKFGKYDSEVSAPTVTSQWQVVDMGSCNIPLKYGSYLDFNPHANAKIMLPFVGIRSVNLNEIMGATLYCKYYVDMLTGASLCMLKVAKVSSNSIVTYTYECNTSFQIPLTANNYNQVITSLISAGISAGSQNYGNMSANIAQAMSSLGSASLTESGKLTANSGMLGEFTPYVILEFPVPSSPNQYNNYKGMPCDVYTPLNNISGFTRIDYIHLDIPNATDQELSEIEQMLKTGVIF